jgi:hypothetical protein
MINDTTRTFPRSTEEVKQNNPEWRNLNATEATPYEGPYTDHGLKEPPTVVPVVIWIVVMAMAVALVFVRMYGG